MKAMVYDNYGSPDVLELREIEKPSPKDDEVLIKVHAASVNAIEYRFLLGTPFLARIVAGGLLKPKRKVLGVDIAGQDEAVGANFKQFQPGDDVFGLSFINGAFAEYFLLLKIKFEWCRNLPVCHSRKQQPYLVRHRLL
jgi:NADPH:quinone reductase-like Zn-dependent oxidoreductase